MRGAEMKRDDLAVMKAVALCYKPYLRPREAQLYCGLEHSQLTKRMDDMGLYKTAAGYYRREDLDLMMAGGTAGKREGIR
jgi:hypothetical protein